MTFNQLELFVEICSCGSFIRAAENCHLTQPTLTKTIKSLENELGLVLFSRSRKGIELTEAGKAIHDKALLILSSYNDLSNLVHELQAGVQIINLGIIPAYSYCFLPEISEILMKNGLEPVWNENSIDIVIQNIKTNSTDIGVLPKNVLDQSALFDYTPYRTVEYGVLASTKNKLKENTFVNDEELNVNRLIIYNDLLYDQVFNNINFNHLKDSSRLFLTSQLSTILELVSRDIGISIVIKEVWEQINSKSQYIFLPIEPVVKQDLVFVWKKNSEKLKVIQKAVAKIKNAAI